MEYYSACLIFIILINNGKDKKKHGYDESIVVFKAKDYQHAFQRALELVQTQEITYKNVDDQDVRWAFVEVSELKCIGKKIDGVEVSSVMFRRNARKSIPFDKKFRPEKKFPFET